MKKSLFRDKYVRKFQQGGGMITPLNPSVFRTPIPQINPNFYAQEITPGADVNLILNENARRESAALQREQMQNQKDLLERRAELEQESAIFNMMMEGISSTGGTPVSKNGQPVYYGNDIMSSKRFEPQKTEFTNKSNQLMDEILKARSLPGDQKLSTLFKKVNDYKNHVASFPANSLAQADQLIYSRALEIASDPKSKYRVNTVVFNDWMNRRNNYLNAEPESDAPGYYKLGEEPAGLYYDYDATDKRYQSLLTALNTSVDVGKEVQQDGSIIKEVAQKLLLDSETASDKLAETVLMDRDLLSYFQDNYRVNLNFAPEDKDKVKGIIKDIIKTQISFDDKLKAAGYSNFEDYVGQAAGDKKESIIRYITDKDGNKVEIDDNTYNKMILQDFTFRHFDPSKGIMNRQSALEDPEFNNVLESFINNIIPPITGFSKETFNKLSGETYGLLSILAKEYLSSGGMPNDPDYLALITPTVTKIIAGDMDGQKLQTEITELKKSIENLNTKRTYEKSPNSFYNSEIWQNFGAGGGAISNNANTGGTNLTAAQIAAQQAAGGQTTTTNSGTQWWDE